MVPEKGFTFDSAGWSRCRRFIFLAQRTGSGSGHLSRGPELYCIDLTQVDAPYDISIGGEYPLVIHVEKGAVCFQEASCPDQVCVRTGRLSKSGQGAVCLPAKVTIQVTGPEREFDAYTGF